MLLDGQEIDRYRGALHGIALDLGTSTVVLRLLDLATGEAVADTSFENPQRFAGSDVMARIQYAAEYGPGPLVSAITACISRAIAAFPGDPATIYEVAVAGNSTWADGDWDGDGEFTSQDIILAFQDGNYEVTSIGLARPKPRL